jgi:hypothetical protein
MTENTEQLLSKVNRKFSDIGRANGTAPILNPDDNKYAITHELFIANHMRKLAEKRWEAAKNEAITSGVLGEFNELGVGSHVTHQNGTFVVSVKRNNPSKAIDKDMLVKILTRDFGGVIATSIITEAQKERAGATIIEISAI